MAALVSSKTRITIALVGLVVTLWGDVCLAQESDVCAPFRSIPGDRYSPINWKNPRILLNYSQNEYRFEDYVGDYALAFRTKKTLAAIFWTLFGMQSHIDSYVRLRANGESCAHYFFGRNEESAYIPVYQDPVPPWQPSEKEQASLDRLGLPPAKLNRLIQALSTGEVYLEGSKNPIKMLGMVNLFLEIIHREFQENRIQPTLGNPHDWSKEFRDSHRIRFGNVMSTPKLLVTLAHGVSFDFLRVGTEGQLKSWILEQPLRSVTVESLFRQSYRLNQGDLYLTFLAIENVLSKHWKTPGRENLALTWRLTPIANSFGNGADHFGTWYHFFGVLLFGYAEGALPARAVGEIESIGSHILGHFRNEEQEDAVNRQGGIVGGRLIKRILDGSWSRWESDPRHLETSSYLDLNEDFSARLIEAADKLSLKDF